MIECIQSKRILTDEVNVIYSKNNVARIAMMKKLEKVFSHLKKKKINLLLKIRLISM